MKSTDRCALVIVIAMLFSTCANASLISFQGGPVLTLLPNTANQQLVLLITGTDFYTDSTLNLTINGGLGPAPAVTAVFGDTASGIPSANFAGSVWAGGFAAIGPPPNGTTSGSSGLELIAGFAAQDYIPTNAAGVYAVLTISTVGVPAGSYEFRLEGTDLSNGVDLESFDPIPVPLELGYGIWNVPEPSNYALAGIAIAALVFTARRKGLRGR